MSHLPRSSDILDQETLSGAVMLSAGCEIEQPVTWRRFIGLVNGVLARLDKEGSVPSGYRFYNNPHYALHPKIVLRRDYAYLCWGVPKRRSRFRGLRLIKLKLILKGAKVLIVHDPLTRRWIRRFVGREAKILPHPVDTRFFRSAPDGERCQRHVVVPGNNDRDEKYVASLALHWPVVRVTSDPVTRAFYEKEPLPPNSALEFQVPWTRLRSLYQSAVAVVLPTGGTTHAAGQTSMLEALACGTPVFTDSPQLLSIAQHWGLRVHRLPRSPQALAERLRDEQAALRGDERAALPEEFTLAAAWPIYLEELIRDVGRQEVTARTDRKVCHVENVAHRNRLHGEERCTGVGL